MTDLGRQIRVLREKKGMTQKELASIVGITPNFLSLVESGRRFLSIPTLTTVAQALDHKVGFFLEHDQTTDCKVGYFFNYKCD